MKKIIALFMGMAMCAAALPAAAKTQREVWESSPGITCGVTGDEIMFNKAVHAGAVRMYNLSGIGERYYLGAVEEQRTDGGSNEKKKTSNLTYYSILETDDGFIILGKQKVSNEYYWNGNEGVLDISGSVNKSYYTSQGYEAPYYIINPHKKYTYSGWNEYDDYIFIGSSGSIAGMHDWSDYGQARYPMIYGDKLCTGQNMYYKNEQSYYYYLSDGRTKAVQKRIIGIKNNSVADVEDPLLVAAADVSEANGYKVFADGMEGNMEGKTSVKDWWQHYLDNKFSDGRYVTGRWVGMGNNIYEIWYDIYDKDGRLLSTGASDYSKEASSTLSTMPVRGFVINDTKIILCLSSLGNSWFSEYYRSTVVTENESGIIEVAQPLGKKNILSPENTDTEPVKDVLDFAADNLELGFNIRNNIIDTGKFTPALREQINAVHLNDVVIIAKNGAVSGRQNAGTSLESYNKYDYSFGGEPIYFYTNGSNFNWLCTEPENLEPGIYDKTYEIGGKSIYITIKVIAPPSDNHAVTVVF